MLQKYCSLRVFGNQELIPYRSHLVELFVVVGDAV